MSIAATTDRRVMSLVRGWAPFVLLLVAYEVMRGAASALGMPAHDLARLDRTLFAGNQPTLVLQAAIGKLADADLFEDAGSLVYATHFLLPVAIGGWLWAKDREAFRTFGLTLVVLCALAFVTYVVAPTAPPWLAQPASVRHLMEVTIQRSDLPSSLVWLYSHHDYNLYAAFPSLHAGFPVVAAAAAWRRNRGVGMVLWLWAIIVWLVVVYLGEHYVADVIGGIVYAVIAIAAVRTISSRPWRRRLTSPAQA
ncbi:MAG TPA: phosphatase PAP2 family protein [Candidatus Dormibacteraeota bacterium]|nr:phosphatase PAP2 family protein [Candidatus Dormibacteraeota bacterium]